MRPVAGILGGMGPQASIRFYELCIEISKACYGAEKTTDYPHLILSNLPIPDVVSNLDRENEVIAQVCEEAKRLEKAGVDFIVMPCNTMHLYSREIQNAVQIPFVSMIEVVAQQMIDEGLKRVGLLGSLSTMRSGIYIDALSRRGIEVSVPDMQDQHRIAEIILAVIAGRVDAQMKKDWQTVVMKLRRTGVQKIILGCTELSLLVHDHDGICDTLGVLAKATCKKIFLDRA